jgi:hypothetical protein
VTVSWDRPLVTSQHHMTHTPGLARLLPWPDRRRTAARRFSEVYREQANVRTDSDRAYLERLVQASDDHP